MLGFQPFSSGLIHTDHTAVAAKPFSDERTRGLS